MTSFPCSVGEWRVRANAVLAEVGRAVVVVVIIVDAQEAAGVPLVSFAHAGEGDIDEVDDLDRRRGRAHPAEIGVQTGHRYRNRHRRRIAAHLDLGDNRLAAARHTPVRPGYVGRLRGDPPVHRGAFATREPYRSAKSSRAKRACRASPSHQGSRVSF